MNLIQNISKKSDYDMNKFSKKSEQKLRDPLDEFIQNTQTLNNHENKRIALEYEITRLKQDNRELVLMKMNLQKSLLRENNSTAKENIGNRIKKIESKIANNDAFIEHAIGVRRQTINTKHILADKVEPKRNEMYKIINKLQNNKSKKEEVIRSQNRLIDAQKKKEEKRFKDLREYNGTYRNEYEDMEEVNEALNTLFNVFQSIENNITNGFVNRIFKNGESDQTYIIINNVLEIRLNLEQGLDNKDIIVKIRFKKPGQYNRSNIRMLYSKKQKDTMIIERVNTIDNEIPVSCSLYLAFVLCTFLKIRIIELFDNNDRNSKYNQYMSNDKPVGITKDVMYSHDLSYFNDYGFEDKLYNKYEPVFHNCNDPENAKYCEINHKVLNGITFSNVTPITFILMIRNLKSTYLNILEHQLSQIVLSELQSLQDLCLKLPCFKDVFDLPDECTDTGTFTSIVNYYNKSTKFGYSTNSYHMFPFPYSANF